MHMFARAKQTFFLPWIQLLICTRESCKGFCNSPPTQPAEAHHMTICRHQSLYMHHSQSQRPCTAAPLLASTLSACSLVSPVAQGEILDAPKSAQQPSHRVLIPSQRKVPNVQLIDVVLLGATGTAGVHVTTSRSPTTTRSTCHVAWRGPRPMHIAVNWGRRWGPCCCW